MSSEIFRNLHDGPDILLLPNAWDAGSARFFESLGAKAIATTSAGLAWSHGYQEGDAMPIELLGADGNGCTEESEYDRQRQVSGVGEGSGSHIVPGRKKTAVCRLRSEVRII